MTYSDGKSRAQRIRESLYCTDLPLFAGYRPIVVGEPANDHLRGLWPLSLHDVAQISRANASSFAMAVDRYFHGAHGLSAEAFAGRCILAAPKLMQELVRLGSALDTAEVAALPAWQLLRFTVEVIEATKAIAQPGSLERIFLSSVRPLSRHLSQRTDL